MEEKKDISRFTQKPKMKKGAGNTKAKGTRRRHRRVQKFNSYVFKVLKQVHPDIGITMRSMKIMDNLLNDMYGQIAAQAGQLCRVNRRQTMSSREVQTAVRLLFPGELGKHAVSEGIKACTKFKPA